MKKYVVYMKNQFCLTGKEFFLDNGDKVDGMHDPKLASAFGSKEEAEMFAGEINLSNLKVMSYEAAVKKFEACTYKYRSMSKIDKVMSRPYASESADEVLAWWIAVTKNSLAIKTEHYQTWPKLYSMFSVLFDIHSYTVHTYKKKFISFRIAVGTNTLFADFQSEMNKVIGSVTYVDGKGWKIFDIFDDELNQFGQHILETDGTNWAVTNGVLHSYCTGSMEKCFEYIRNNFTYTR